MGEWKIMTDDEFAGLVRKGDAKFRVSKVTLFAEGQKFRGHGILIVGKKKFELELEVSPKYQTPEPKRELWKPEHAWKLTGQIEGGLEFCCDQAAPRGKHYSWRSGKGASYIQKLSLECIELVPRKLHKSSFKKAKHPNVEFHAVLPDCAPVFLNAGTNTRVQNDFLGLCGGGSTLDTFIDRDGEYDFALIRKEVDTHIHLKSKSRFHSKSVEDDWRRFYAFLAAVGFTHGFQPWPYRIEYWRGGRKAADRIKVPGVLSKTSHAPFDDGIGYLGNQGRKGAKKSAVRLAAKFFSGETKLSKKLSHLLFLFREAGGASVNFHIKTLAMCSLFEGIVTAIFDELKLEDDINGKNPELEIYQKLRDRLVKRLSKLAMGKKDSPINRLIGSLTRAEPIGVRNKFQTICEHLGLGYEGNMQRHFKAWNNQRHQLMHGTWALKDSDFLDQSLIASAINILVLKLMGYSGQMKANAFAQELKDRYRVI
jgi:hypothetical protein